MKKLYIRTYVLHLCEEGGEREEGGREEGGRREGGGREEGGRKRLVAFPPLHIIIMDSLLLVVLQLAIPNSSPSLSPFSTLPLASR